MLKCIKFFDNKVLYAKIWYTNNVVAVKFKNPLSLRSKNNEYDNFNLIDFMKNNNLFIWKNFQYSIYDCINDKWGLTFSLRDKNKVKKILNNYKFKEKFKEIIG